MNKETNIFYSLPEVWDFCLEKIYNKELYTSSFIKLLGQYGITQSSTILDAGCGSGFPAINLIERGYHVTAIDKSSEMVRQIRLNAQKRTLNIEAYNTMWGNLSHQFGATFDFVYCRGNSLVYAASWEQNWIVPKRSREEILLAIKNFYQVLKPGGKLYLDMTKKDEQPHEEKIGLVQTERGPVEIVWRIDHDTVNKVRTWTITLKFRDKGQEKKYSSYSYLLPHGDLIDFLQRVGFNQVDTYLPVAGEKNYDVFIAHKN